MVLLEVGLIQFIYFSGNLSPKNYFDIIVFLEKEVLERLVVLLNRTYYSTDEH